MTHEVAIFANDGTGVDVISGVVQELDVCDIVIAGTSCKDASMLSIHQSERRTAVSDASFTTGSTAAALVKIVVKCGASRVYMENVPGLKHAGEHGSNFDDLNSIWEAAGFEIRDVSMPKMLACLAIAVVCTWRQAVESMERLARSMFIAL